MLSQWEISHGSTMRLPDALGTHAVVIGGSVAGLTAARVLSDHFDWVTIVERDRLPDTPDLSCVGVY